MMLDYLNEDVAAGKIRSAIEAVYETGRVITKDQGGAASTREFFNAITTEVEN